VARRVLAARAAAVALIERARVPVGRAGRPRRTPGIRRTAGARAVAGLGRIALTARGAAARPGVARRVLAARAAAVALIERARVPVGRAGRPRRTPGILRAGGAGAVAGLGRIALTARGAAARPGVARRVLAARAAAVALIERARVPVGRAARPRRTPGIRRTAGARAVAGLGRIALTARGAAGRPGVARRVLAARAAAVALIERARVLVGRAARPRRTPGILRTGRARAVAGLGRIALTARGAAGRPGVARRVLAALPDALALFERARVPVGRAV